jgi:L-alanine-DL-glutamate epimerase-like enolase superfamily enzyme
LKITNIETLRVAIPFETGGPQIGMRPGLSSWTKMESLMVRVETEDGLEGWGEAFGHVVNAGTEAILHALVGPAFLGKDARAIATITEDAQRMLHGVGRNGPALYALSGIDIALWDLAAKRAGQPLYRLLGGQSGELKCYASLMRYGGDGDALARNCQRARDAGYLLIKLHENTIPAFLAARKSVEPSVHISLDVNCPWTVDEARAIASAIRDSGFHWLEEPVFPPEDFGGIARVRQEGVPIAAGENIGTLHEFRRAFEAGALDIAQPSVTKVGGVSVMTKVIALAQAHSVRVVPHCFYWGPGYLATAHVAASMARPALVETAFIKLERSPHPLFESTRSTLSLPDTPGLGFQPNWPVLEQYMVSRRVVGAAA